jgi:hypothetical protein
MSRTRTFPSHDFKDMNAEEIALLVEADIKSLARKWKHQHPQRTVTNESTAATETAALYLQANHALYFRADKQDLKDAHQNWMMMMREWFLRVVEKKKGAKS